MAQLETLDQLNARIVRCRKCPRLVQFREQVARVKVRRFRDQTYWGRPLPGFGDPAAKVLIVGLAPAAHGGNRTGRIFTGDRSGDWLYEALHRFGFSNQPESVGRDDGLQLHQTYIAAAARCAPPANRPTQEEQKNCRRYLIRELTLLDQLKAIVPLGSIALEAYWKAARTLEKDLRWKDEAAQWRSSRPPFGHNRACRLSNGLMIICSYHPSQQNTQTGKLTRAMFHDAFRTVRRIVDAG